jgi:hypothetical protein
MRAIGWVAVVEVLGAGFGIGHTRRYAGVHIRILRSTRGKTITQRMLRIGTGEALLQHSIIVADNSGEFGMKVQQSICNELAVHVGTL